MFGLKREITSEYSGYSGYCACIHDLSVFYSARLELGVMDEWKHGRIEYMGKCHDACMDCSECWRWLDGRLGAVDANGATELYMIE